MRNPLSKKVVEIQPSGIRKFFDLMNTMQRSILALYMAHTRRRYLYTGKRKDFLYIEFRSQGFED